MAKKEGIETQEQVKKGSQLLRVIKNFRKKNPKSFFLSGLFLLSIMNKLTQQYSIFFCPRGLLISISQGTASLNQKAQKTFLHFSGSLIYLSLLKTHE